jgi:hypothetical protein
MGKVKIVQFVSFETVLNAEEFITQWEQYKRSVNSDLDVSLQQSEKNDGFRYIAQHRCPTGELKFMFTRAKKSSRLPEPGIKASQLGGYLLTQEERTGNVKVNESKVFAFFTDPFPDLNSYRQLKATFKLNVYEAYYENCQYAFILEFFVTHISLSLLLEELKALNTSEPGVYRDCVLQAS